MQQGLMKLLKLVTSRFDEKRRWVGFPKCRQAVGCPEAAARAGDV